MTTRFSHRCWPSDALTILRRREGFRKGVTGRHLNRSFCESRHQYPQPSSLRRAVKITSRVISRNRGTKCQAKTGKDIRGIYVWTHFRQLRILKRREWPWYIALYHLSQPSPFQICRPCCQNDVDIVCQLHFLYMRTSPREGLNQEATGGPICCGSQWPIRCLTLLPPRSSFMLLAQLQVMTAVILPTPNSNFDFVAL